MPIVLIGGITALVVLMGMAFLWAGTNAKRFLKVHYGVVMVVDIIIPGAILTSFVGFFPSPVVMVVCGLATFAFLEPWRKERIPPFRNWTPWGFKKLKTELAIIDQQEREWEELVNKHSRAIHSNGRPQAD